MFSQQKFSNHRSRRALRGFKPPPEIGEKGLTDLKNSKMFLLISVSNRMNMFSLNIFYHTTETLNYFFRNRVKYNNLVTNSNIKSTKYNVITCILKKKYKLYGLLHFTASKHNQQS